MAGTEGWPMDETQAIAVLMSQVQHGRHRQSVEEHPAPVLDRHRRPAPARHLPHRIPSHRASLSPGPVRRGPICGR